MDKMAHLVDSHELLCSILLRLRERHEFDIAWWSCLILERRFDGVKVMGSNCDELPTPTQVLMKFILQINEGFVG